MRAYRFAAAPSFASKRIDAPHFAPVRPPRIDGAHREPPKDTIRPRRSQVSRLCDSRVGIKWLCGEVFCKPKWFLATWFPRDNGEQLLLSPLQRTSDVPNALNAHSVPMTQVSQPTRGRLAFLLPATTRKTTMRSEVHDLPLVHTKNALNSPLLQQRQVHKRGKHAVADQHVAGC